MNMKKPDSNKTRLANPDPLRGTPDLHHFRMGILRSDFNNMAFTGKGGRSESISLTETINNYVPQWFNRPLFIAGEAMILYALALAVRRCGSAS
jgi:hypothetical protein